MLNHLTSSILPWVHVFSYLPILHPLTSRFPGKSAAFCFLLIPYFSALPTLLPPTQSLASAVVPHWRSRLKAASNVLDGNLRGILQFSFYPASHRWWCCRLVLSFWKPPEEWSLWNITLQAFISSLAHSPPFLLKTHFPLSSLFIWIFPGILFSSHVTQSLGNLTYYWLRLPSLCS